MVDMYRGPEAALQPAVYRVRAVTADAGTLLAGDGWDSAIAITWGPASYATTLRAIWNPSGLFVRFDATDHAPWSTRTQRDDRLWEEEVVEVFLDPTGSGEDYAEIEISPVNVVCDLHIERLAPERLVHLDWDLAGLQTVVHRSGRGDDWCAIAHMPFEGFASLSPRVAARLPVTAGDVWHFNAFRIKRPGGVARPEDGAVYAAWSVPEGPTFHAPLAFRPLVFEPPDE